MELSEQIKAIKKRIEEDKQKISVLKGREQENLKQLSEYDLKSFSEAEKWLNKTEKDIIKREKVLQEEFDDLLKEMLITIKKTYGLDSDEEAEKILFE